MVNFMYMISTYTVPQGATTFSTFLLFIQILGSKSDFSFFLPGSFFPFGLKTLANKYLKTGEAMVFVSTADPRVKIYQEIKTMK